MYFQVAQSMVSVQSLKWIGAAMFYAVVSFSIVAVNKSVLTIYKFPSVQFLSFAQLILTVIVTDVLKFFKLVSYPEVCTDSVKKVMPLPFLHLCNLILGLGSTQTLSIPMFTVLRRFTVLFVMIGEVWVLGKSFNKTTCATVFAMLFGVIVASVGDLAFDIYGYIMVLSNNLVSAAYFLYVKKINDNNFLGKFGMMYYNSLISLPFSALILYFSNEMNSVLAYEGWSDFMFCFQFILCLCLGYILVFSAILCTSICGPLTFNVVGVLKSAAMTYVGMFFGGDYIFGWLNFTGITISAAGAVVYSAVTFQTANKDTSPKDDTDLKNRDSPSLKA